MGKRSVNKGKKGKSATQKVVRSYTTATLKKLGMLSRNLCAFPGCPHRLVEKGLSSDAKAIVGHICHIYGASEYGPRGKEGLTTKEKNSFENLILMCGAHHPIIDKFDGDYDAATLLQWKKRARRKGA